MKIKPNQRKAGGVMVELGPQEPALPVAALAHASNPLPIFKLQHILVPVDFSDCSAKALQYAVALARQFNARLTLLHVVAPYRAYCPEAPILEMPTLEEASAELNRITTDIPRMTVVREGEPHAEIVAAASDLTVDLIVLSTHGRTGIAHVVFGSTAEKVVRHAGCPVLVIRDNEHEFVTVNPACDPV
jgi:universal stress protein A